MQSSFWLCLGSFVSVADLLMGHLSITFDALGCGWWKLVSGWWVFIYCFIAPCFRCLKMDGYCKWDHGSCVKCYFFNRETNGGHESEVFQSACSWLKLTPQIQFSWWFIFRFNDFSGPASGCSFVRVTYKPGESKGRSSSPQPPKINQVSEWFDVDHCFVRVPGALLCSSC